jgi:UDPglucose 6-dehydrogenase
MGNNGSGSRVAVVGTGYVGLTTGACLAHLGHRVTCVDIDEAKVERLRRAEIPIREDGLEELVVEGLRSGRLEFSTDTTAAVTDAEFVCLCVPTPERADGTADLSFIESAASAMAPHLQPGTVVINKSTVPVGSTNFVADALGRDDVSVVSNPEFLREGSSVHDFLHPDRVVIGAEDEQAALRLISLYVGLTAPVIVTDPRSAELIKYASNAYLATKLSFINEIAALAEALGADMEDVALGVGSDPRIGRNYLNPGPGWGGSCLPKDTQALLRMGEHAGHELVLLRSVVDVNDAQYERMVDKVAELVGAPLVGRRVAVWGLTFKAGTDDLRRSPALEVVRRLLERGAEVHAYDPAITAGHDVGASVKVLGDPYDACDGADVLLVLTEWPEFKRLDLDLVAERLEERRVVDTRNLLDRAALRRTGFDYRGVGRA